MVSKKISIKEREFKLLSSGAVYWPEFSTLLLADMHLGKKEYFQSQGIPIPSDSDEKNLQTLISAITFCKPKHVYFLGDTFHSRRQFGLQRLHATVKEYKDIMFTFLYGNHDTEIKVLNSEKNILLKDKAILNKVVLVHDYSYIENPDEFDVIISGHIHPGLKLKNIRLPVFYLHGKHFILPAFGTFTGFKLIKPDSGDIVYPFTHKKIYKTVF